LLQIHETPTIFLKALTRLCRISQLVKLSFGEALVFTSRHCPWFGFTSCVKLTPRINKLNLHTITPIKSKEMREAGKRDRSREMGEGKSKQMK
jgi:hypothetical protein